MPTFVILKRKRQIYPNEVHASKTLKHLKFSRLLNWKFPNKPRKLVFDIVIIADTPRQISPVEHTVGCSCKSSESSIPPLVAEDNAPV